MTHTRGWPVITATALLAAAGIGLLVWWLAFSSNDSIDPLALVEDACEHSAFQDYDIEEEMRVKYLDDDQSFTFLSKGRYSPEGFELLVRRNHSDDERQRGMFTQGELIVLYDVGEFARDQKSDGVWGEWRLQYWDEKEVEYQREIRERYLESDRSFCGYDVLHNLKYIGEDTIDGKDTNHYTAEVLLKTEHGYGPHDYHRISFWIDTEGRPIRKQIETEFHQNGFPRYHLITTDYSAFGVPNEIAVPTLP